LIFRQGQPGYHALFSPFVVRYRPVEFRLASRWSSPPVELSGSGD
jgi:hypothetical protein